MDDVDAAQRGLTHYFGARGIGAHNSWPHAIRADLEFDYWWLAHLIDARVDGFERSGDGRYLLEAERIYRALRLRNGGRLFNRYFDDMMWLGCALARLGPHTHERYLDDAERLWRHALARGWNDSHGPSLAWRSTQLDYKNAPANGPFAILGARLERIRPAGRAEKARAAFDWMHTRLRDDASGFVADGIGREGGSVRDDRAFSYNHGVYIGAAVALHRLDPDPGLLADATLTALDAIRRLAPHGVFVDQGSGDGALFGGIYCRFVAELLGTAAVPPAAATELRAFVESSTRTLVRNARVEDLLRAGPVWDRPAPEPSSLAAQLSAVLALEAAAVIRG
ncbi:glycosyl hydrolase [Microbacteriaceae bacterium VKM Ac-2854]|nr:glycosyl hydrolase [Microbacteriaceae bacterium VKM Ac-2854]